LRKFENKEKLYFTAVSIRHFLSMCYINLHYTTCLLTAVRKWKTVQKTELHTISTRPPNTTSQRHGRSPNYTALQTCEEQ